MGLTHQSSYEGATLCGSFSSPTRSAICSAPTLSGVFKLPRVPWPDLEAGKSQNQKADVICIHGEPMQSNHLFYFIYEHFIY